MGIQRHTWAHTQMNTLARYPVRESRAIYWSLDLLCLLSSMRYLAGSEWHSERERHNTTERERHSEMRSECVREAQCERARASEREKDSARETLEERLTVCSMSAGFTFYYFAC